MLSCGVSAEPITRFTGKEFLPLVSGFVDPYGNYCLHGFALCSSIQLCFALGVPQLFALPWYFAFSFLFSILHISAGRTAFSIMQFHFPLLSSFQNTIYKQEEEEEEEEVSNLVFYAQSTITVIIIRAKRRRKSKRSLHIIARENVLREAEWQFFFFFFFICIYLQQFGLSLSKFASFCRFTAPHSNPN